MSQITFDKAVTVNENTWWVNSRKSGLIKHALESMISQLDVMLSYHNKVFVLRFDIRLYSYTEDNQIITNFNRRLFKWLKRYYKLKRVGFVWCREHEKAKQQHYHYALFIDGCAVRYPIVINRKIKELVAQLQGSYHFSENCYHNLKRGDYESIHKAIYHISYLAKARGKGNKPKQTKSYGTSRIKMKTSSIKTLLNT
jgi:hypothetical protein